MIIATPTPNRNTRSPVRLRATSWLWKKSMGGGGPRGERSGERDARGLALLGRLDLEELGRGEPGHPGDDVGREDLAGVVVGHDRVVERLPGERHLVLGRGQL